MGRGGGEGREQLSFSLFAEPLIIISVQSRRWHAIVRQLGEPAERGASPFLKGDGPSKSFIVLRYHPPPREPSPPGKDPHRAPAHPTIRAPALRALG